MRTFAPPALRAVVSLPSIKPLQFSHFLGPFSPPFSFFFGGGGGGSSVPFLCPFSFLVPSPFSFGSPLPFFEVPFPFDLSSDIRVVIFGTEDKRAPGLGGVREVKPRLEMGQKCLFFPVCLANFPPSPSLPPPAIPSPSAQRQQKI